ncbi:MAG: hypothetical protein Q8P90_00440 [bacterium]|nr:hypothetical protein [bacterium]
MDFPNQTPAGPQPAPTPAVPGQDNMSVAQPGATPVAPTPPTPMPVPTPSPAVPSGPAGATPQVGGGPIAAPAGGMVGASSLSPGPGSPVPMSGPAPGPIMPPVQSGSVGSAQSEVHTMPQKFMNAPTAGATKEGGKTKKGKGKMMTVIIVLVIILAVAGIIGGVAFYILRGLPEDVPVETPVVVVDVVVDEGLMEENVNADVNDNVNADDENDNENVNANDNENANENVNADSNANINSNVNTSPITNVSPSKDTDKDQLTNEEEKLFGTKADLPDTDSDGYNDGAEILAGFDPQSTDGAAKLVDNSELVSTYSNKEYGYNMLYPAEWTADEISETGSNEVLFTPTSLDTAGQFVAVVVENNPTGFTAVDWYLDQASNVKETQLETITTFDGVEGVLSLDGYTAYFTSDEYVYGVSYRYGSSVDLHFDTTFALIAKSFELTKATKSSNNTNKNTVNSNVNDDVNANSPS